MKTTNSLPIQVKRIAVLGSIFLASMGFVYSLVKYALADQPNLTFLLPVFLVSTGILITLIGSAQIAKH